MPVQERHLPSTEVPLLLNFGAPHRRQDLDAGEWTARDGVWVVGLHARHQLTQAVGERHFMVVRFTPIGAHLFLGLPMHLIANEAIDLEQIDSRLCARTRASRWDSRGAGPSGSPRWNRSSRSASPMQKCRARSLSSGAELVATDGRIALGSLDSEIDCSHRTLIARFRTCVGFPPKTIARLLRFNRVMRSLDRSSQTRANETVGKPYIESTHTDDRRADAIRWADIAADCGYFDQAHLIKEFREFAGSTPDAFLRRVSDVV